MRKLITKTMTHPAWALGSVVLWGVFEFVALQRRRLDGDEPRSN